MTDPPDDLADLLAPRPGGPSPTARDALLRHTERWLARASWLRRGVRAAAVVGVFAAGGVAGWLARAPVVDGPGSPAPVIEVIAVPVVVPVIPPPIADAPSTPVPTPSATAAEQLAEQADDAKTAARHYRQAGDTYLREQDYPNATRCYRLYLARIGDPGLALDSNDSWLLVSLKNAAYKEKVNGTQNDS